MKRSRCGPKCFLQQIRNFLTCSTYVKRDISKNEVTNMKTNPVDRSNLISRLCFCWLLPYFIKGYRKVLTEDDMYANRTVHDSETLGDKLEAAWEDQRCNKKKTSLVKAICSVFLKEFLCTCLAAAIGESCRLVQPFIISEMLTLYDENKTSENQGTIYVYATLLVLSSLLSILSYHYFVFQIVQIGMKMRISCSSLIYRKSLKLSQMAFGKTSAGQIVNLLSNDVGRLENTIYLNHLFMAPLETILVIILMYMSIGWYGLIGTGFMVFSMFISSYLGKKISEYRMATAKKTDKRILLMNQILSGIEVVKMFTWEKPFGKLVELARKMEIQKLRLTAIVRALTIFSSLTYTKIAMVLSILVYTFTGNIINSSYVFTLTTFFRLLSTTTTFFPVGITQLAEMLTSIKRIQNFLLYEDCAHTDNLQLNLYLNQDQNGCKEKKYQSTTNIFSKEAINLTNITARWYSSSVDVIKDLNLKVRTGELVSLIGPSGSGKSTLLNVILQELSPTQGSVTVSKSISYAPQEPWLFGGTVKENILFGEPYEQKKYKDVVRVCSLEKDFELLQHGDGTLTGDRGFALSGGQRTRINLARAIYRDAEVYLLDDPLSAVDNHVGKQIFESCILGYLKNKTVILVTHQIQYLKKLDNIYLLKDGSLKHFTSYYDLKEYAGEYFQNHEEVSEQNDEKGDISTCNEHYKEEQQLLKEDRGTGKISGKVYKNFFLAGGNWMRAFLVILFFILAQATDSLFEYFVTYWINAEQEKQSLEVNFTILEPPRNSFMTTIFYENHADLYYVLLFFVAALVTLTKSLYFYMWCIRISTWMHKNMFNKVIYNPMIFFNQNPPGRILNRFSKDLGNLDEVIPVTITETLNIGLNILAICVVVGTVIPWILIPSAAMFVLFYFMRKVFLETSRDVKRVESITRAPLYTQLAESLHGITTIRAFKAQEQLKKEFDRYQNLNSAAFFLFLGTTRTYGFWLDLLCVIYIAFVLIFLLFVNRETLGGNMGLALTQAMGLTLTLQRGMRLWGELENQLISVERIQEYIDLEPELDNHSQPPKLWPQNGRIEYKNVTLRYSKDSYPALNSISFTIEPKEKVGIVGRTGAGKSSLLQALLRLANIEGSILIDNIDSKMIALEALRSKISIIPQVPILFSGSVRKNLDPFEEHNDEVLWKALEDVEMKSKIQELPESLNTIIVESGANFSIGQKQLLCLARAIIHHNKILFLDEATSNVDPHTDSLIQKTIRAKFAECTVLTIAHRLHTVMDSDKVLVMDNGKIVEFDCPDELLKNTDGYFYSLVRQSPISNQQLNR